MDQLPYLSKTFPKSPSIVRCQVLRFLPIWPTFLKRFLRDSLASQVVLVVKNPPASAGDVRDTGLIPWKRAWKPNPLRISWTEEPGGGAMVHRVEKNQT